MYGWWPVGVWSLSLEEQFYLTLPILVALAGKYLVYVCSFGFFLQFFFDRSYLLLWFTRTNAILLGVLLAVAARSDQYCLFEPRILLRAPLRWIFLVLLCIALGTVIQERMVPFGVSFVAMASAALVFAASYNSGYLMSDGYLRWLLVWVGSRSYSIYLTHVPALLIVKECWSSASRVIRMNEVATAASQGLIAILLIAALSELNFKSIEAPLRTKDRQISKKYLDANVPAYSSARGS